MIRHFAIGRAILSAAACLSALAALPATASAQDFLSFLWGGGSREEVNIGTPRLRDDCPKKDADNLRVVRGGSSFYEPLFMRSASRLRNDSAFRNFSIGFRVARTLLP